MSRRINIVLPDQTIPDQTIAVLNRVATKGTRSRFIDRAISHLVETEGKQNLRQRLIEEAIKSSARDLTMAVDWFPLEEEAAEIGETIPGRQPVRKRS